MAIFWICRPQLVGPFFCLSPEIRVPVHVALQIHPLKVEIGIEKGVALDVALILVHRIGCCKEGDMQRRESEACKRVCGTVARSVKESGTLRCEDLVCEGVES